MQGRQRVTVWRKTFGRWRSIEKALVRYAAHFEAPLQNKIRLLINLLVTNHVEHRSLLKNDLPAAANSLTAEQLGLGLDLAIRLAERAISPVTLLKSGLVAAAESLDSTQFYAAIDFAMRLADSKINPSDALQYAVPTAAKNTSAASEFQANLEALERFIIHSGGNHFPNVLKGLPALAALAPVLFRVGLEAASCFAERELDPSKLFDSIRAAAMALPEDRLRASLDLTMHFAKKKIDLSSILKSDIAEAAKTVSLSEFLASLEAVSHLAEKRIQPDAMLRYGIPAAASARTSPADFQANLSVLERFVIRAGERNHSMYRGVLTSLSAATLTPEQFRISLEFATRLASDKSNVAGVVEKGLCAALSAGLTPSDARINLDALEQFMIRISEHKKYRIDDLLPLIPQTGLTSTQFCAGLEVSARLAANDVDPAPLLRHGLRAAVTACKGLGDFEINLGTLEESLSRLGKLQVSRDQSFGDGLQTALNSSTRADFESGLKNFEALVMRLAERKFAADTAPGLAELTRQANVLRQCYEDFELVLHEAITSEYESYDSYYGTSSTETRVDHPQWIELLPGGRRRLPLSLAMLTGDRIERLLKQRSWLWRYESDDSNREKVIERVVHWRAYLPLFIDRLMRQGVLDPATKLHSIHLFGSYPWVAAPNDLDLFLVVSGASDVVHFTGPVLKDRGVHFPELLFHAPTRQSRRYQDWSNAQIPELPGGISIEIVGHETLLKASRGETVLHGDVLAKRYAILYGSVLLGGDDLFRSVNAPVEWLREVRQELLDDRERAGWPELAGDKNKIDAKRSWRKREADALEKFITET